jgi:parallel beta-helix repeat protein
LISNTDFGILLYENYHHTTIVDNTITNSSNAGVYFDNGTDALVVGNTLSNNYHGIDLFQSNESRIYHNSFINNTLQVVLFSSFNTTWDDGYPSGGNYWSNYTGIDENHDGIGDTPHIIDPSNQDPYPLMNPWPTRIVETTITVEGEEYAIIVESNATITNVTATKTNLNFTSSGPTGQEAYINATIPIGLNKTEIKVSIDNTELIPPPYPIITTNGTHYFIYFEFTLSTHNITIQYAIVDIATTNITPAKTVIGQGYTMHINATIQNQGHYTETFNVTIYANTTEIGKQLVTLSSGNITTVSFVWNSSGFVKGNYIISAYASPVSGETDTGDNSYTGGMVEVLWKGDVNKDDVVDGQDAVIIIDAIPSYPGHPNWNPYADINGDDVVDGQDAVICIDLIPKVYP